MKARMRPRAKRHAMRMLICTAMCLFALSAMMVTAYATDGEESTATTTVTDLASESTNTVSDTPTDTSKDADEPTDEPKDTDTPTDTSKDADEPTDNSEDAADSTDTTSAAGDGAQNSVASAAPANAAAVSVQSASAAGEDNPAEPEPAGEEVEAYAIPAGSAYIHEISKEVKYNNSVDNNGNAINEAMKDALTYLLDHAEAERVATIVVQDGLYLGGVDLRDEGENTGLASLITKLLGVEDGNPANGELTIRVVAHDAIVEDDQGNIVAINAESQGNVKLEGGINININEIDGLNILFAGLYLSTRDTVSIRNAASVKYYGTAQNDTINLSVSNIAGSTDPNENETHILVDSGGGNDTVTVEVRRKPTVSATVNVTQAEADLLSQVPSLIDPGTGFDDVLPYINALKEILVNGIGGSQGDPATVGVNVVLGDGEDVGSIKLIDASDVIMSLADKTDPNSKYTFGFVVDMGAANVMINGGDGEDRLSVSGGRDFSFAQDFLKAAVDFVTGELDGTTLPDSSVTIQGGKGDDLITVDTTTPFAAWGNTDIQVEDQAGFDRLHLTGKLNNSIDEDNRISVNTVGTDGMEITIEALAQITLLDDLTDHKLHFDFTKCFKIFFRVIESLTDALLNKRTVAVEDVKNGTLRSFTNYVVTPESGKNISFDLDSLKVQTPKGGVLFSNLILTDDLSKPISGKLGIDRLNAGGLNLLVIGEQIDVFGPISAKNVILSAYGEDEALAAIDTSVVKDDLNPDNNIDIELGLYKANRDIYIKIAENQQILADQVIDLNTQLILNKGFIPGEDILSGLVGKDFNPVTLKFGNADVIIYGNLFAGGCIHARSNVDVTIDAENELLKVCVPITLAVSSGHSQVIVGKTAHLVSGYCNSEGGQREQAGILISANSVNDLVAYTLGGSLKFSISLAVVEFETVARITDSARIDAGGALKVLASSIVDTTSYATGKPSNVWNVKPQSGLFIAGNFVFNTTTAVIDGSADASAQDDVAVDAFSDVRATTVSLAIPYNDKSASEQMTPINRAEFMAKLLGGAGLTGKASEAISGSNGVGKIFKDATASAGSADGSSSQFIGALGIAYIDNAILAKVDVTESISTPEALLVHATGRTVSDVRADGSLYRTPSFLSDNGPYKSLEDVPKNAIGAAVAIEVLMHSNEASISRGTVSAKELSVKAQTLDASSEVVSKAGHTPEELMTKLGIGGAVSVHVANVYNSAVLSNGASYDINGGDVEVISTGSGRYTTVADASGKRTRKSIQVGPITVPLVPSFQMSPKSAGVGAGIAVEVINIDAIARIEDGVTFGQTPIGSLKTEADYKANFYIQAAAGSTGGISVTPVMALTVSSVNTKAVVGKLDGAVTELTGDVVVTANTEAVRKLISDAKAVGSRAGVGAAVGLSILDDSALAELDRSVRGQSVEVAAQSISRVSQNIYASAAGANPLSQVPVTNTPSGVTSDQFDDLVSGKDEPRDATGTPSMNRDSEAERINKNNAAALSNTAGHVNSMSGKNGSMTSGSVSGLASKMPSMITTEGSVQVAASIATNVHSNKALASIADGLSIEATGDVRVTSLEDTDAVIYADSTACNSTVGVGAAAAVNYVEYENKAYVGAKSIKADNLIIRADVLEAANRRSVDEVMAELLRYLADTNTGRDLLANALCKKMGKDTLLECFTIEGEARKLLLDEYVKKYGENEQLSDDKKVEKMLLDIILSDLKGDPLGAVSSGALALADSLVKDLAELFLDPSFLIEALLKDQTATSRLRQELEEKKMVATVSLDLLLEAAVTELTTKYGNPSELEKIGNRISTSAVSGTGAANVGVAGSLALTILKADAQAILSGLEAPDKQQDKVELTGILEMYAQSANKVYTTASSSAADNGLPVKNKIGSQVSGKRVGVGASFAMTEVDAKAEAIVGENRTVTAEEGSGALSIESIVHNDIDTVSVAGQDPIGRQQSFTPVPTPGIGEPLPPNRTSTKDIAVDASVALNIVKNTVTSAVNQGACLTLSGGNIINTARVTTNDKGETVSEQANLYLRARQRGQTYATSSGFGTAEAVAVGGSVAVNLSTSDVSADLDGEGDIRGRIIVDAETLNEDESQAFAMTYGASLDRYFEKIRTVVGFANVTDNPSTGGANAKVVEQLNSISSTSYNKLSPGMANSPLMTMVLGALGLNLPNAPTADNKTASNALENAGAAAQDLPRFNQNTVNIAAAVGVNVTAHKAKARIGGSFTAQSVDAKAENRANYRAYATGANIATSDINPLVNANVISVGVAVSVNHNEADAMLDGKLTTTDGAAANAILTQNLDGRFAGLLAAQSLAGAVGSKGKGVGLAFAVSVVKTFGKCSARILDNAEVTGGDVVVKAVEKSRIAVRAGGFNVGSSTVCLGASFALIYDENQNLAKIGKNATITAKSLEVRAEKQAVTADDYQFPFDRKDLFTVSEGGADGSPNEGLVHVNISDTGNKNSLEVNLKTEDVLGVVDMLNYLSSVNYYMESVAGTLSTPGPSSKASLPGAFSMLFAKNETSAEIDEGATIVLTDGKATVEAKSGVNSRVIAGSLTATNAVGVGVNIAGFDDRSSVNASVGMDSKITAREDITVSAEAENEVLAVTVAAVFSEGIGSNAAAVGGTVDVILTGNNVNASVGENTKLISKNGSVSILAKNVSDLILVSTSMNAAGNGPAVGGTFAAAVSGNKTYAKVGKNAELSAAKDVTIRAESEENMLNVLASASAAVTGKPGAAGVIGVLVSESFTEASVGDNAVIEARSGAVNVLAQGDVKQIVTMDALTFSGSSAAADAAVNVGVFEQTVAARVGTGTTLTAGGNVNVMAGGRNQIVLVTFGGTLSSNSPTIAGTIPVVISQSEFITEIGNNSVISAGDSIAVASDARFDIFNAAGNLSMSIAGSVSVGATVSTVVVQNQVLATIGSNVTLRARAAVVNGGVELPNRSGKRSEKRRGVVISANAYTQLVMASVSGSVAGGNVSVSGVVNTLVFKNTVKATVGENGIIEAGFSGEDAQEPSGDDAEAAIESSDETHIYNLAGEISVSGTAGVGTTVVTMVYDKTMEASVGAGGKLRASGSVRAAAESFDDVYLLALNFVGSGTAAVGVGTSALVFENDLFASLGGSVTAGGNVLPVFKPTHPS